MLEKRFNVSFALAFRAFPFKTFYFLHMELVEVWKRYVMKPFALLCRIFVFNVYASRL